MHSLRTKSLFLLVLELHPTTSNNKLQKKYRRNAELQKKKENKARTRQY
jgi:hypothetical protein